MLESMKNMLGRPVSPKPTLRETYVPVKPQPTVGPTDKGHTRIGSKDWSSERAAIRVLVKGPSSWSSRGRTKKGDKEKAKEKKHQRSDSAGVEAGFLETLRRVECVKEYLLLLNAHKLSEARAMVTDDFKVVSKDNYDMTWDDIASELEKLFESFPDFALRYGRTEATNDGVVIIHNLRSAGTHSGRPYAFGPYEAIEATGEFVESDHEVCRFHFRDGKLCRGESRPLGENTGPAGMYARLGGAFPFS